MHLGKTTTASLYTSVVLILCFICSANAEEDYTVYAQEQARQAKKIIVPYKEQIAELIKNVAVRQEQAAKQKHKDMVAIKQCPYSKQNTNITTESSFTKQLPIAIFVSFSMPQETIKAWISQAGKIGVGVYIRGLVNNSFKETVKAVGGLLQNNKGGLLIDPTLFKKYAIVQVPAVVLINKDNFDVVYGNVTLDYALEKINKARGGERKDLLEAIKKVRSKNV